MYMYIYIYIYIYIYYINGICQEILYISKFVKKYNTSLYLLKKLGNINLYQQTVLLKIIYDGRIEISFMEK